MTQTRSEAISETPKYRHELKYEIGLREYFSLRQRLRIVCRQDPHADAGGEYLITSLYFDNCYDKALREKRHGTDRREKFRFLYYNGDPTFLRLEKKQKNHNLCLKSSCAISAADCRRILEGDRNWLSSDGSLPPLLQELGFKMTTQMLRPKTVVSYRREAYIYGPGNVRITFDKEVAGCLSPQSYLEPKYGETAPLRLTNPNTMILEVKYDEFLPDIISGIILPELTRQEAISKYAACRNYEF